MMYMRLQTIIVAGLLAAAMLLMPSSAEQGPADEWPTFHHDWARSGYTTSDVPDDLQLLWSFRSAVPIVSSPAVVDDKVYFVSGTQAPTTSVVYALSAKDGSLVWSYPLGSTGSPSSNGPSPTVVDGRVYVGSWETITAGGEIIENAYLYTLNAENGSLLWRFDVKLQGRMSGIDGAPAVVDNRVYFGSWNGYVYCLNAENGDLIWSYSDGDGMMGHVIGSPAVVDGVVYFGTAAGGIVYFEDGENIDYTGWIYALNAENSDLIWKVEISDFGIGGEIASAPVVVDNKLFIGGGWPHDNQVYCFDARSGSLRWKFDAFSYVETPVAANDTIFFYNRIGDVYALNAETGEIIWNTKIEGGPEESSLAIAGEKLLLGKRGHLYILNIEDGSVIWRYYVGPYVRSSPAISDGKVFIGYSEGIGSPGGMHAFGQLPQPMFPCSTVGIVLGIAAFTVALLYFRLRATRRVRYH